MKLAVQEGMLPGATYAERAAAARGFGFEGIEVSSRSVLEDLPEIKAALADGSLPVSTVCGSGRHDILCLDAAERAGRLNEIRRILDAAGEIGAEGLIIVPIRTGVRFPDLSPFMGERELETELAVAVLQDLASYAAERGTRLLLEPLIRYETPFIRRLAEATAICERVSSSGLAMMADFFHMATEEADPPASIRAAGRWLRHVHLADSNRQTPGRGHTDFTASFRALMDIGFQGYLALECGIPGTAAEELPRTVAYLQGCLHRASQG